MSKIWVVMGATGEYSDQYDWPVLAYDDAALAQAHVEKATRRANEIQAARESQYEVPEGVTNEFDPSMRMDYTGTSYFMWEVELAATHKAG